MIKNIKQKIAKHIAVAVAGIALFTLLYTTVFNNKTENQPAKTNKENNQIIDSEKQQNKAKDFNIVRIPATLSEERLAEIKNKTIILNDIIYYPNCGEVGCQDYDPKDPELLYNTEYPDVKESGLERTVHILNHPVKHIIKSPSRIVSKDNSREVYVDGLNLRKYFANYCYTDIPVYEMHIRFSSIKGNKMAVSYLCPGGYFTSDAIINEEIVFTKGVNCKTDKNGFCIPNQKKTEKSAQKVKKSDKPAENHEIVNAIQDFLAKTKRTLLQKQRENNENER